MAEGVYASKPWLKSYDKGVPEKIQYEKFACRTFWTGRLQNTLTMALNFQGYTLTYKELKDMVDRFATYLAGAGIKKEMRLPLFYRTPHSLWQPITRFIELGAIVVLNNPLYSDRELEHQLNDSGSKLIVTVDLLANRMIDLRPRRR